jgi:hypothetical protein
MKKQIVVACLLLTLSIFSWSQDTSSTKDQTSYDRFLSKSGTMIRFQDYKMPELRGNYQTYENRIRILTVGADKSEYYQIVVTGKYSSVTGSISYEDMSETIKAIDLLLQAFQSDNALKPDYLENKFVTKDGVAIGYYISSKDSSWYINLDRYKSDSTVFIKDGQILKVAFYEAQKRMDILGK